MQCPKCRNRTEVLETLQRGGHTRRRRRCLSALCVHRFSTVEGAVDERTDPIGILASLRRIGFAGRFDAEAVAAAISVDRRKRKIERERRAAERYDDEHAAPRSLNQFTLRRELKGH